jgi:hypothetical protein
MTAKGSRVASGESSSSSTLLMCRSVATISAKPKFQTVLKMETAKTDMFSAIKNQSIDQLKKEEQE